jgi:uncharacterized membrane protein
METLRITFALVSILMIVTSIPMILRKVPPNPIYGFRTRKTLSDPEIWYEANAYAGKLMFAWGIFIAVGIFEVERIPGIGVAGYSNGMLLLTLVVGAVVMALSFAHINRLG